MKPIQTENNNWVKRPRFPKYNAEQKQSNWVSVSNGFLKIGHKPGGKKRTVLSLKNENVNTVLTILGEQEDISFIREPVKFYKLDWLWLPLRDGKNPSKEMDLEIIALLEKLRFKLNNGERIYIHCTAGLHRTGMITNLLLLFLKYDQESAIELIYKLRQITALEVSDHRLDWGAKFLKRNGIN